METSAKTSSTQDSTNLERAAYVIAGTLLVYYGARKRNLWGAGLGIVGADLFRRGATGASLFNFERPRIDRSITIEKPKEEVFAFWRNLTNLPQFIPRLKSVKRTGPLTSHWTATLAGGNTVEWDAEIIHEEENRLLSWKSLPGSRMDHAGSIHFDDAPGGRGTVVRIAISYKLPGGKAVHAIAKRLGADPGLIVTQALRNLKSILEAGQIANTSGQVRGKVHDKEKRDQETKLQHASESSFPASDSPASW